MVRWGPDPHKKGQFSEREGAAHCKVYGHSAMSYAKTAVPIEIPFALCFRIGPRNHVVDGVQIFPWEGTILRGKGRPL